MDHPEILATLESQDTTRRQTKQKTKHHTKHHTEKMSNTNTPKIGVEPMLKVTTSYNVKFILIKYQITTSYPVNTPF